MSSFEALKPKIEQRPCPICGGKDYGWGFLTLAEYKPDSSRRLAMNAKMLRARCCLRCNHVDYFADAALSQRSNRIGIILVLLIVTPALLYLLYMIVTLSMR